MRGEPPDCVLRRGLLVSKLDRESRSTKMNSTTSDTAGTPASHAAPPSHAGRRKRWTRARRVALWRAGAGMAVAFGIACAIVLGETSTEFVRRNNALENRIRTLRRSLTHLDSKSTQIQRELASENRETSIDEALQRVLVAPDLRTFRLVAPRRGESATGVLVASAQEKAAMLTASGLEPTRGGEVYRLWWMGRHGTSVKAVEFAVVDSKDITVSAALPPTSDAIAEVILTLEPQQADGGRPSGAIALRSHPLR
jgi:hypothetical protein